MEDKQIPLFKVFMHCETPAAVSKVLTSGYIGEGEKVKELESELRKFLNHEFVLTTNSATSAQHLAWLLLKPPGNLNYLTTQMNFSPWNGLKNGDEVLTCPLSCLATFTPIILSGLKIKWVDVDPETMNIDLVDLERKITHKTRAIQLVLWGGYPVDLDKIAEIQEKTLQRLGFKPAVLIDCAHAFGSKYKGKHISEYGHMCTYSFQAIKHLTGGDLGALTVPHQELYRRGKNLRWYGLSRELPNDNFRCGLQDVAELGTKWHCNDIAATILLSNLPSATTIINKYKDNARYYDEALENTGGVTLLNRHPNYDSASWIYSMLVDRRDDFIKKMASYGIQTSQVHERCDKYSALAEFRSHLPVLDSIIGRLVNIPVHFGVSEEDREFIVKRIYEGW